MFGQQDSNSLTITASTSMAIEPDQALFQLTVTSSLTTGLDQIVAALQSVGITAANLSSVYSTEVLNLNAPSPTGLQWTFVLPVPLSKTNSTTVSLAALQQTISQNNSGLILTFNLAGTQVSQQLQQSQQCPISNLLADATAQAQALASATGLAVGPVVALAQGNTATAQPSNVQAFIVPNGISLGVLSSSLTSAPACSLTVKFTLLRYH